MTTAPTLLVVGARENSLGHKVFDAAREWGDYDKVVTAGISDEHLTLDVTNSAQARAVIDQVRPDHVVVTTGVNEPAYVNSKYLPTILTDAFRVNVIGVMDILRHWLAMVDEHPREHQMKFVAISSNSARIPRTRSMPYCASKAALSMALRVAARELANEFKSPPVVWGYEPGLLDTALTHEMMRDRPGAFHRMMGVGEFGLDPVALADRIIGDLRMPGTALNGCMIPYDAGEL